MLFSLILACTEVGLVKYTNSPTDSAIVDTSPVEPSDSSEPSITQPASEPSDTQQQGLEGIGGYFNYTVSQVACPACVGETQQINIQLSAKFHDPTNQSHTEWIPNVGECTNNFSLITPSVNPRNYGNQISVINDFRTLQMYFTNNEYNGTIYETEYDRDTLHTVLTDGGDFQFESIHGFDSIEPQAMLYVDPSYAFAAPIYRSGATFWWTPAGSSYPFMVTIAVYTPDGASLLGYVSCVTGDVGQMTVPGQYLSQFPAGSITAIHLERHKVVLEEFIEQGTYIETHMSHQVVGTGFLQ
tara:strand:+ start:16388 stop:17284 length:897 start_codon:yes stop_codon:yes gene_type:complete